MLHTIEELNEMKALPLKEKITLSQVRIVEFYEHYKGNVVVSFSGGVDSTVLLHLARSIFPEIKGVYCDTGLEFPEVKEHVKQTENVEIIRPAMNFREVIREYGWVYPSKEVAFLIDNARAGKKWAICRMNGQKVDGTPSGYAVKNVVKWKKLVDAPVKISDKCCEIMKKKPFSTYIKEHKCGVMVGTMTEESMMRKRAWLKNGCNAYHLHHSMPLSFWTRQDVLQYVIDNKLKIPSVYGDIVKTRGGWETTELKRTGCMFCPIAVHLEKYPNRYQKMAKTHPKIYDYCINQLGLKDLLDYIGVDYMIRDNKQLELFG